MKIHKLAAVAVSLLGIASSVNALEPLMALGRKAVGTLEGYDLIQNGKTPVIEINADAANYPDGFIPGEVSVRYLTTAWGKGDKLSVAIRTCFAIYEAGHERDAIARVPNGARAVAFAAPRALNVDNGRAMEFTDTAVFRLDRYLPPGRYQVFAYTDVSGDFIHSEVLPRGTFWFNPAANTDGTYSVATSGEVDRRYSAAARVDIRTLQRPPTPQNPKLSIGRWRDETWVTWSSAFPDYSVEWKALNSTQWIKITKPGEKNISILVANPLRATEYGFQANFATIGEGALLRLTPGGLSEATGKDIPNPVTQP